MYLLRSFLDSSRIFTEYTEKNFITTYDINLRLYLGKSRLYLDNLGLLFSLVMLNCNIFRKNKATSIALVIGVFLAALIIFTTFIGLLTFIFIRNRRRNEIIGKLFKKSSSFYLIIRQYIKTIADWERSRYRSAHFLVRNIEVRDIILYFQG